MPDDGGMGMGGMPGMMGGGGMPGMMGGGGPGGFDMEALSELGPLPPVVKDPADLIYDSLHSETNGWRCRRNA